MIEKLSSLLDAIIFLIKTNIFYRPFLKSIGFKSIIWSPRIFRGKKFISIGNRVFIRYGARIEVIQSKDVVSPKLIIGNNVNIEQNVHIICGSRIVIGDNVSITGNVAIVDVNHPYDDVRSDIKIGARYQAKDNYVEIGRGSFIGFGCVVLPNVKIGEGVVVGANSVVTTDIPSFSVATGNPAKVIKRFNFENHLWEKA